MFFLEKKDGGRLEDSRLTNSYCFSFEDEGPIDRQLLGGKGAALVEMTRMGIPVPPGFAITTNLWHAYQNNNKTFPDDGWAAIEWSLQELERKTGMRLGDEEHPLFVSVRSGAPLSMPGILETKINLGLNERTAPALERTIGKNATEELLRAMPASLPQYPWEQIRIAIQDVFDSWNSPKAYAYRQKHNIGELGTAATIQQMVWGNSTKEGAGTGVLLSRDTQKFSDQPVVIFAPHAQGPSVVDKESLYPQVAITELGLPEEIRNQLLKYAQLLEQDHKLIPQDIEFTYDGEKLWILQTRDAPLSPLANLRSLEERIKRGYVIESDAISFMSTTHLTTLTSPELDPQALREAEEDGLLLGEGISISVGNKVGRLVFSLAEAISNEKEGEKLVLADPSLESFSQLPQNVDAVLLDKAGVGSHLAREGTQLSTEKNLIAIFGIDIGRRHANSLVTVDGNSGKVYLGSIPLVIFPTASSLLTLGEYETAQKWLSQKRENPWRSFGKATQQDEYEKNIEEARLDAERRNIRSLKAREIMAFNAAIPRDIRQHYTVVKLDTEDNLIQTIRPILGEIFTKGHHATIRTCHDPALPANGPWAFIRSMDDFEEFLVDSRYSEKYGGFPQFLAHPQLTELLVGDIPIGKMEKDLVIQYEHCAWTLSCTENGMVILQVRPHSAHLREHEKVKRESLVTFTTRLNPNSPNELAPIREEIGFNLRNDKLAYELAEISRKSIFYDWWNLYELPQRLAAITSVLGINTTFEGQATKSWCLGYGIKTR